MMARRAQEQQRSLLTPSPALRSPALASKVVLKRMESLKVSSNVCCDVPSLVILLNTASEHACHVMPCCRAALCALCDQRR